MADAEAAAVLQRVLGEGWKVEPIGKPFSTELTPAGEQTVIPGCERNLSPKAKQLDLFG